METNKFNETVEKFELLKINKTLFSVCEQWKCPSKLINGDTMLRHSILFFSVPETARHTGAPRCNTPCS